MVSEKGLMDFAEALRAALAARDMTRAELAERAGLKSASAVTNWLSGTKEPRPDNVFAVERVLELKPGTLSRHLGYKPAGVTELPGVEEAIISDGRLSDAVRESLITLFRIAVVQPLDR